jgi:undecaprenyl-diphosphatase
MLALLQALDDRLFFLVNNGWSSRALDPVFEGLSSLGAWTIVIVALVILAQEGGRRFARHAAVLSLSLVVVMGSDAILKRAVDRPRPLSAFAAEIAAGTAHVNVREVEPLKRRSFPSGHTVLAFFVMTYVGQWRRGYRPYLLVLASAIGIARVYVGSHFPSDCLAGALIGTAWALAAWRVRLRMEQRADRVGQRA